MMQFFLRLLQAFHVQPKYQSPPRTKISKKYEEMTPVEQQREQARLDDFMSYLRHEHPDKVGDDTFRGIVAAPFFGAWQAGFEDEYFAETGTTPLQEAVEKAVAAGIRSGATRAVLWPVVDEDD